ncbi:aldo/keto reductase [Paraburkholderia sp. SIMBA_049]
MEYRQLGSTGLRVSKISLGTMTFGLQADRAIGSVGIEDARNFIAQCVDVGVNLIDTADVYGKGESESVIGEAMGSKRSEVLIATKLGGTMAAGPNERGSSRHHIISSCEASLKRLRTDHIDLYQLHKWDGMTPLEETMEAMDRLVRDGKVRYIGCSNFSSWHTMKAQQVSSSRGWTPLVSQQIHYTLQAREAEFELVPMGIDQGLGVLVWGPIAGGLLSGKFRRGQGGPEGSRHFGREWHEPPIHDENRLFDIVDVLVDIAEARGCTAARVAIAWLLYQPGVTSVLIGGRSTSQFADNLAAAELELSFEELSRLETASRPKLPYPYWHQAWTSAERLSTADKTLLWKYQQSAAKRN